MRLETTRRLSRLLAQHMNCIIIIQLQTYETVAEKYLENKLTAPSARDPFFRCCLLHLANDVHNFINGIFKLKLQDTVGAENAIVKYSDLDPSFANTREAKFVKGLITAIEAKSVENFSTEW